MTPNRPPRILSPDAPPAPKLKTVEPTIRQIAKRYGKRYADQVKTLRHRVAK